MMCAGLRPIWTHVDERDSIGIARELGPQGPQPGLGHRHQHRLVGLEAFTEERDGAREEVVEARVEERLVLERIGPVLVVRGGDGHSAASSPR